MTRQQSEGEVHVEAMRLILAEMERREDLPDWTIWQHMLNMLETIFEGIEDQRDDDRDELMHTRKDRDAARAEIETLRGAMAADDQRLRDAEQRIWPERTLGCDAPDAMADEILHLREQLRTAAGRVDLTEETNRSLRQQLDAAQAAVTLQRAGIERLQAFVGKVRRILSSDSPYSNQLLGIEAALKTFDAGTEPTPVAERCPECDGSGMVDSGGFGPDGKAISVPCGGDCSGKPCPSQPAPVAEPLDAEGGA